MATTFKAMVDWPKGVSSLAGNITAAVETITLASDPGTNMSTSNFWVRIGFEQILVASRTTVTLTCTGGRGANGTTAAVHLSGDSVTQDFVASHISAIQTAVNTIETTGAVDALSVGGGYGSTGLTVTAAGACSMNGALIVDGASTLTGGATIGSTTYPGTISSGYIPYATGANALGSSANLTFDGTTLTNANYIKFDVTDKNTRIGLNAGLNIVSTAINNTYLGNSVASGATHTTAADNNTGVGYRALLALTSGTQNTIVGMQAGDAITDGGYNTAMGVNALTTSISGLYNSAFGTGSLGASTGNNNAACGYNALGALTSGGNNTALGVAAGGTGPTTGGQCLFLGYAAGKYETTSYAVYIDTFDRTNTAGDKAGALLYGVTNAVPANQLLTLNAAVTILGDLAVNGGDITSSSATANIYNTVSTTVNMGAFATTMALGAGAASTLNANFTTAINLNTSAIASNQTTVTLLATPTIINFGSAASTAINVGHASGATVFAGRIRVASVAASTTEGDIWLDSTQKSMTRFCNGIKQHTPGVIFVATADKTVGNTATETSLFGSGIGTLTLPANFMVAGKSLRLKLTGVRSTKDTAPGTTRFKLYVGSAIGGTAQVATAAITDADNLLNEAWTAEFVLTCRTTGAPGTAMSQGVISLHQADIAPRGIAAINTAAQNITTTGTLPIDVSVTYQTANAANTITCTNAWIEIIA